MPGKPAKVKANPVASLDSPLEFGRDICNNLEAAERREWLVTNGIGGYASGTMAGLLTRRYHGLLVAALKPPLGRTLLVTKIDEIAGYDGNTFSLGTNRWMGGAIDPRGFELIQQFRLEGTISVWTFACSDALIEKRICMEQGANTTYVSYKLASARQAVRLSLKVLVNHRDFHCNTHAGDWRMEVQAIANGVRVIHYPGATPFYLLSSNATAEPAHIWYRNYFLSIENSRGFDGCEDSLHAVTFHAELKPGEEVTLVFSTDTSSDLDGIKALDRQRSRERALLARWDAAHPPQAKATPAWIRQLALAADQFIVARPLPQNPTARSVIAGYHWFGDWGRDTMIALPGLTLATGRPEIAKEVLLTFVQLVDQGMLPNTFPEGGDAPQFNTADSALWFFEAAREYVDSTRDIKTLRQLFPVLAEIINQHVKGTRYKIRVDPADSLLYAGEPGVALTWMDAKVGDWVVTPRIGKPVEVNALWFNALLSMARFARALKKTSSEYESMALHVREGSARFWNNQTHFCFDVLDGPEGNDATFRPNQIFAISLTERLLSPERARAVVDACEQRLLTPRGLRSISKDDPKYRGHYGGSPHDRDGAYHQGTVWGWLLGPFIHAHLRVYKDRTRAAAFLEPMKQSTMEYGLGTAGEIFDGEPPFAPRGCIAQAWTVGELLRAWLACNLKPVAQFDSK